MAKLVIIYDGNHPYPDHDYHTTLTVLTGERTVLHRDSRCKAETCGQLYLSDILGQVTLTVSGGPGGYGAVS